MAIFARRKKEGMTLEMADVRMKCFGTAGAGVDECHAIIRSCCPGKPFKVQLDSLFDAFSSLLDRMPGFSPVFERFFISDAATQQPVLEASLADRCCAVSIVEQPPLDGTKVAMWAWMMKDAETKSPFKGMFCVNRGSYTHMFAGGITALGANSRIQTREALVGYGERLGELGCNLADNCVRTWFFVQNIDVNYHGVVAARNEVFSAQGLLGETHFIASTGIGGRTSDPHSYVGMDAYSVKELLSGQMTYLYAPTHMNRTSEYGVSFERGVCVDYGDRRHVMISGTASIDNKGRVVHPGDIRLQTERMLENVATLLGEAGCGFEDTMHMIVYLRDMADYTVVSEMFGTRFPETPLVVLLAPICRPGWLVEMECMAVKSQLDRRFPVF